MYKNCTVYTKMNGVDVYKNNIIKISPTACMFSLFTYVQHVQSDNVYRNLSVNSIYATQYVQEVQDTFKPKWKVVPRWCCMYSKSVLSVMQRKRGNFLESKVLRTLPRCELMGKVCMFIGQEQDQMSYSLFKDLCLSL